MRVLICGDRNWTDVKAIEDYVRTLPKDTVVIEGEASGADSIARRVAEKYGLKVVAYVAQWTTYGRAAGPIRNRQMLEEGKPDIVVAFHNNIESSKGTKNCLRQAEALGIKIMIKKSVVLE